jgi:hypothetical protein
MFCLEPWVTWSNSAGMLESKTSLTKDQIEELERLCHSDLLNLRQKKKGTRVLSTMNMLLLTLTWLWTYPKAASRQLASDFHSSRSTICRNIKETLEVLSNRTKFLREWPSNYRRRIDQGDFKRTIGAVDSFPILLHNRPHTDALRRKFWYYRERRWAYKVQTFVGLDGKILDATDAVPYSTADQTLYSTSTVHRNLDARNRAIDFRVETEEEEENSDGETEKEESSDNEEEAEDSDDENAENSDNETGEDEKRNENKSHPQTLIHKALGDKV